MTDGPPRSEWFFGRHHQVMEPGSSASEIPTGPRRSARASCSPSKGSASSIAVSWRRDRTGFKAFDDTGYPHSMGSRALVAKGGAA